MNPGVYQASDNSRDAGRRFHIAYSTTNPDGSGELSVSLALLRTASASYIRHDLTFMQQAEGPVYYDVITQHGANLTVPQAVLGAIDNPTSPPTFPHDGLIGYAGQDGASLQDKPFVQALCDTGALSACRFGLALKTDGTGNLHYGTVATDEFSGELTTVQAQGLWSISGDVTVDGNSIVSQINIATDSGTTVIFGPTNTVSRVFKAAGITGKRTSSGNLEGHYSCSKTPTVGFSIGGKNFNIDPKALAFKKDGDDCTASLIGTSNFGGTWLVGQAFFQGRYIDHNIDDGTMGFANLK